MTRTKSGDDELPAHPYLTGNFASVSRSLPLTPCSYDGTVPDELAGGQYVRNGGNSIFNEGLGRDYHWFDGDGMLSGMLFQKSADGGGNVQPHFVNQFILTDLYLSAVSSPALRSRTVPSISTLINPATSLLQFCACVLRTLFIVFLSHLPGSTYSINRISVANTGLVYHDGRVLATCESGPPMRVQLPELRTVGWFGANATQNEEKRELHNFGFGGTSLQGFLNEWTTGHPKIDPANGDLILYHCTFVAPYVFYTVIPSETWSGKPKSTNESRTLLRVPIPGVSGPKMMHDFGVSLRHTIIMDLPLSLDPLNLLRRKPIVTYDSATPSRFGVFPRNEPSAIRWFDSDPCCIFHTANTWDNADATGTCTAVNFLVCRLTSPALLFVAGNVATPDGVQPVGQIASPSQRTLNDGCKDDAKPERSETRTRSLSKSFDRAPALEARRNNPRELHRDAEEEQCRLFYYQFDMGNTDRNIIRYQFALSSIPFEFPTTHPAKDMSAARYIYGCSTSTSSFNVALGRAVKIDTLVKVDALSLIAKGRQEGRNSCNSCMDRRTVDEIVTDNVTDPEDKITCYKMPPGWYAQEARFVPRAEPRREDDGVLLFYAFDESQLDSDGNCVEGAVSELWVLDALTMRDVVCRIRLPQRVPYGFHGNFFSEQQMAQQRPVASLRSTKEAEQGLAGRLHNFLLRLVD